MSEQQELFVRLRAPEHRVRALATIIAGFAFPGRSSFERLTKPQRERVLEAAQNCLDRFVEEA